MDVSPGIIKDGGRKSITHWQAGEKKRQGRDQKYMANEYNPRGDE